MTNDSQCRVNFSTNSEAPTYLIDLDYKPIKDMLIYLKYTRGYRQGGINTAAPGLEVFGPEHVDSYEGGTKNTFGGPLRATLDTAFFYNKLDNQPLQADISGPTFGQSNAIINAGESQIYGIEGEGAIRPFPGFSVDAGLTYLNTLLIANTPPPLTAGSPVTTILPTATAGHELTFAPTYKTTLTAAYILPLAPEMGRVTVSGTYVYTSGQINTEASQFGKIPATNLLNLNLNWTGVYRTPVDASVFITNATNLHYVTAISGAYDTAGFESAQLGAPRMFGVRLRYHFGS